MNIREGGGRYQGRLARTKVRNLCSHQSGRSDIDGTRQIDNYKKQILCISLPEYNKTQIYSTLNIFIVVNYGNRIMQSYIEQIFFVTSNKTSQVSECAGIGICRYRNLWVSKREIYSDFRLFYLRDPLSTFFLYVNVRKQHYLERYLQVVLKSKKQNVSSS